MTAKEFTDESPETNLRHDRIARWLLTVIGSINPTSLIGGFWLFVYGLMVYLPACTAPQERGARPLGWWHYPLAVVLPFVAAVPVVPVVVLLRQWLGIELFPGA